MTRGKRLWSVGRTLCQSYELVGNPCKHTTGSATLPRRKRNANRIPTSMHTVEVHCERRVASKNEWPPELRYNKHSFQQASEAFNRKMVIVLYFLLARRYSLPRRNIPRQAIDHARRLVDSGWRVDDENLVSAAIHELSPRSPGQKVVHGGPLGGRSLILRHNHCDKDDESRNMENPLQHHRFGANGSGISA